MTTDFDLDETQPETLTVDPDFYLAMECLRDLDRLLADLVAVEGISQREAQVFQKLTIGMECAERHFAVHPIASYTRLASRINYNATQEGIGAAIVDTAKRIVKAIIKFFTELPAKLWSLLTDRRKKLEGLEKMTGSAESVLEVAQNNAERDPRIADVLQKVEENIADKLTRGLYRAVGMETRALLTTAGRRTESAVKNIAEGLKNADYWIATEPSFAISNLSLVHDRAARAAQQLDEAVRELDGHQKTAHLKERNGAVSLHDLILGYKSNLTDNKRYQEQMKLIKEASEEIKAWGKQFDQHPPEDKHVAKAIQDLFSGPFANLQKAIVGYSEQLGYNTTIWLGIGALIAEQAKMITDVLKEVGK